MNQGCLWNQYRMIAFFWMVTKQIATDKRGVQLSQFMAKLEARKLDIYVSIRAATLSPLNVADANEQN